MTSMTRVGSSLTFRFLMHFANAPNTPLVTSFAFNSRSDTYISGGGRKQIEVEKLRLAGDYSLLDGISLGGK